MRLDDYAPRPAHIKWLLDSDPAIRWQVMRDLTGEATETIAAERSRVATEGWGAQLLARQSPAGNWGGSARGWRDDLYRSRTQGRKKQVQGQQHDVCQEGRCSSDAQGADSQVP